MDLSERTQFDSANYLTPIGLESWIRANSKTEGWELKLWEQFILLFKL